MKPLRFEASTSFPVSQERLWRLHVARGALEWMTPWWSPFVVASSPADLKTGAEVTLRGRGPLRSMRWRALVAGIEEGVAFTDTALSGPFPFWVHQHEFIDQGPDRSVLKDTVWVVPPAWLPARLAGPFVRFGLRLLFRARHRRVSWQLNRTRTRTPSRAGAARLRQPQLASRT